MTSQAQEQIGKIMSDSLKKGLQKQIKKYILFYGPTENAKILFIFFK